jgi:hypothetical protein
MPPSIDPSIEGGTPQIFTQYYLAGLSQASHLLGDETTGRAVVADPRRDVAEYGEARHDRR